MHLKLLSLQHSLPLPKAQQAEGEETLHLYPRTTKQCLATLRCLREAGTSFALCPISLHSLCTLHLCQLAPLRVQAGTSFFCNLTAPLSLESAPCPMPLLSSSSSLLLSFHLCPFSHGSTLFVRSTGISASGEELHLTPYLFPTYRNSLHSFPLDGEFYFDPKEPKFCGVFPDFDPAWECALKLFQEGLIRGFSLYPPALLFPFGFPQSEWITLLTPAKKGKKIVPLDLLATQALNFGGYLESSSPLLAFQKTSKNCLYFFCPSSLFVSLDAQLKNSTRPLSQAPPWQGLHLVDQRTFLVWYKFMLDLERIGSEEQALRSIQNTAEYLGARPYTPTIPTACKQISSIL